MGDPPTGGTLWLTGHWPPAGGGMAQSCDRIVTGLRRSGAEVHVVHLTGRADRVEEQIQHRGSLLVWPLGDDVEHALARLQGRLVRGRLPADHALGRVVAFGGPLPLLAGPVLAAVLGLPLVTLLRGNDLDAGIHSARRRAALTDCITRSSVVGCVSRDKQAVVEALWPGVPTCWTPNGIDLADWEVTAADRARAGAWRQATVAAGRRVIGLFGHLKAKKGVARLITTIAGAGLQDRFHLLLVGELDDATGAALDPAWSTHLPFGDRYDLLSHLPACDVVAVPSFYDGLPNVVLEAAATGIPLLASGVAGMADILTDGVDAWLFDPDDDHDIIAALGRVAGAAPEELAARGAAARRLVEDGFTADHETGHHRRLLALADSRLGPAVIPGSGRP